MVPDDIRRLYSGDIALLETISRHVLDVIRTLCEETGYAYAPRPTPVKTLESVAEKLESGRFSGWGALDDLVACSVVIPTRASEKSVLKSLSESFDQVQIKSRLSTSQSPAEFRFGATRFIGKWRSILPESHPLARYSFEIQVRTAFEHAWSVTTHALFYKSDRIDWRVERIAAQLKASVEQLDMVVDAFDQNASFIEPITYSIVDEQKSLADGFHQIFEDHRIPEESTPHRWGQFAKNMHTLLRKARGPISQLSFEQRTAKLLEECKNELSDAGWSRQLSLYQFALGVLLQRSLADKFAPDFYALITPALTERFPLADSVLVESRCKLESPAIIDE